MVKVDMQSSINSEVFESLNVISGMVSNHCAYEYDFESRGKLKSFLQYCYENFKSNGFKSELDIEIDNDTKDAVEHVLYIFNNEVLCEEYDENIYKIANEWLTK